MRFQQSIVGCRTAAVPLAAITALQGLRDKARVQPGHKVLINGASGGVGTFAVQIAKALGAEVTAVCSTRNVDIARSLGADHVIDYVREDFTQSRTRFDAILDLAGSRSLSDCVKLLAPAGVYVSSVGRLGWVLKVAVASLSARGGFAIRAGAGKDRFADGPPDTAGSCRSERDVGVRQGQAGHRQAVHPGGGPRGSPVSGTRTRPGKDRHHCLRSATMPEWMTAALRHPGIDCWNRIQFTNFT